MLFDFRSYFSKDGIEYNLCRVPIGGTDFSTRAYSYDDGMTDPLLDNFALANEDLLYKVLDLCLFFMHYIKKLSLTHTLHSLKHIFTYLITV